MAGMAWLYRVQMMAAITAVVGEPNVMSIGVAADGALPCAIAQWHEELGCCSAHYPPRYPATP